MGWKRQQHNKKKKKSTNSRDKDWKKIKLEKGKTRDKVLVEIPLEYYEK